MSDQTIYNLRKQHMINTGRAPGVPSSENAELIAASLAMAGEAISRTDPPLPTIPAPHALLDLPADLRDLPRR